jgi:ABC-type glycerol-3-phosphate transport system substrate-binding protein
MAEGGDAMKRRALLKGSLAGAAALAMPSIARAQGAKKLSFLTWNIADQEQLFKDEFADFQKMHPGVEIEWLDKKGTEFAAFYQTQVVAGTAPDVVDLQGALWVEYAAGGGLLDLSPYLAKEPEIAKLYNADYLASWRYEGKTYMLPFYIAKTLLFYNKTMFKEAGLVGPPASFDELLGFAKRMAKGEKTGFLTLNFDWLYWPLFKMNGVELLTPDLKKPAFNTPQAVEVLSKLAEGTESGAINKISWTGRWVEPNGAFAGNTVGMLHAHASAYFFIKGQGTWINPDTLGVAQAPGYWATPTNHGFGISKTSKNPDLAWEFIKLLTGNKWATEFSRRRKLLTGTIVADQQGLEIIRKEDPLGGQVLETQLEHTDKFTGNWPLPFDAQLKDAFYPEIQNAVLGRKAAKDALADAERAVERLLRRHA